MYSAVRAGARQLSEACWRCRPTVINLDANAAAYDESDVSVPENVKLK